MSVADAGSDPQARHPDPDHRRGQRPAAAGRWRCADQRPDRPELLGRNRSGRFGLTGGSTQHPANFLAIYESVGARYRIPWEVLAGVGEEECDHGRNPDPSCTPQPGAVGPGVANRAGASGPMQIGVGGGPCGSAGDEYDQLCKLLPDPSLGPHDPTTAVELAALVLIKNKGAPAGQSIDAYLPYAQAYNGSGPMAAAYADRVIADAHAYQGAGTVVFAGCAAAAAGTCVNPFAGEDWAPSRNDQGVDYDPLKVEPIRAIGAGTIVDIGSWGSYGPWFDYEFAAGQFAGKCVYVAEHIGSILPPGTRFNGYDASWELSAEEAERYHAEQIASFALTEADLVSALTLTNTAEAIGITRAARNAGMPVVISFTLETNGRLPSGEGLGEAILKVDSETDCGPAYYMINCAHPTHFDHTLEQGGPWLGRLRGIRANASQKSHAELDAAAELDDGEPYELASDYAALTARFSALTILGGCCGTDERHIDQIARACVTSAPPRMARLAPGPKRGPDLDS